MKRLFDTPIVLNHSTWRAIRPQSLAWFGTVEDNSSTPLLGDPPELSVTVESADSVPPKTEPV
jgi:hypothetical protein